MKQNKELKDNDLFYFLESCSDEWKSVWISKWNNHMAKICFLKNIVGDEKFEFKIVHVHRILNLEF